ncbi:Protein of unknown function [Escherichia coli D6-113.11]|nr:Protein of unknown function [Escherichia coli D6-113.11]CDU37194.1 Protein of unknown function [Escherichia coli D6-113.11]
MTSLPWRAAI